MNNDEDVSSERMRRFVKDSLANANLLKLTQRDLQATHTAALIKTARKKLVDIVVQKEGVIIVQDVRLNHMSRTREKVKRKKRRQKRAETIRQKKLYLHEKTIAKRFNLMSKKIES